MKLPHAIILGWVNEGNVAQCGETVKNQHIISQLRRNGVKVTTLDFFRWKRRPWVLFKTAFSLLFNTKTPLILSSAPKNVYPVMKLHKWIHSNRKIIQWVIGGNIHKLVEDGTLDPKYIRNLHISIVENPHMQESLAANGVDNVIYLPNFKPIPYKPALTPHTGKRRFVFMSRIKPEKGVDYIIESVRALNAQGLAEKFEVDFYGRIDEDYVVHFKNAIAELPNVEYRGFLNFSDSVGYDTLASYDAMLFPTVWISEGFAGIFIDAFIAGLPVIATRWAHNAEILEDGKYGIIIPPHDAKAIESTMLSIINNQVDLEPMRRNCQAKADTYDVSNVVTPDLLRCIGLL